MTKVTILGSGTSQGIPIIGCKCVVCTSNDKKNKRLRGSIKIDTDQGLTLLVDCGPDFRYQALRSGLETVDMVLITHEHNDHIIGLDDLRPIIFRRKTDLKIYSLPRVNQAIRERFAYAFTENPYPGVPSFNLENVEFGDEILLGNKIIQILEVTHGNLPIIGMRMDNFAYITDAKKLPQRTLNELQNLDLLVINALHRKPHHSHLNLEEAVRLVETLNPKMARLTHLGHAMGLHEEVNKELPNNIKLTFDGEEFILQNK